MSRWPGPQGIVGWVEDVLADGVPSVSTDDLHTKGIPTHDVTAYGAVGDGSTDDASAIQSAIDAAKGGQGLAAVYYPQPSTSYLVESSLTPGPGVYHVGDGYSKIQAGDLGTTAVFEDRTGLDDIWYWGLWIEGNGGWSQTAYDPNQKGINQQPSGAESGGGDLPENIRVSRCKITNTPATAIGIDSTRGLWVLDNHIEGCGTDAQATGGNGVGIGIGENNGRADTYIGYNTIVDTAQQAITLEHVTGSDVGQHFQIFNNVIDDALIGIGIEAASAGDAMMASVVSNTILSSTRMDEGINIGTQTSGGKPEAVAVMGNVMWGNAFDTRPLTIDGNKRCLAEGNMTQSGGQAVNTFPGNVINGFGKEGGGVGGTPTASTWDWARPVLVRNFDDETLWRLRGSEWIQIGPGEPVDLTSNSGTVDGQTNIHDGTGTPPFGLSTWDDGNSQWIGADGSSFSPS